MENQDIRFIRVRGRIVPIRAKKKDKTIPAVGLMGATGAGAGAGIALVKFNKDKKSKFNILEKEYSVFKKQNQDFLMKDIDEAGKITKYSVEKSTNPLKFNPLDDEMGFTKAKNMYKDYLGKRGLDPSKADTLKSNYNLLNLVTKNNIKNNKIAYNAQKSLFENQTSLYKNNFGKLSEIYSKKNKIRFATKGGLLGLASGLALGGGIAYIIQRNKDAKSRR
jgi:hypothetical protein